MFVGENAIEYQGLNVAVENDADEFVRLVDHWTAAVAAYDVRVGNEIKLCCEIQLCFALDPTLGEAEGRLIIVFGSALIESSEIRKKAEFVCHLPRSP